jgi:phage terminase small subunit
MLPHGNASRAAIAAGYSRHTARAIACENLKKPAVADAVAKRRAKRQEDQRADAQRVFDTLCEVACSDISGVLDEKGEIRPPQEWPREI